MSLFSKLRPESAAGGYARDNGGVAFYGRVNALLEPEMTVVDLGAGRGTVFHSGHFGYYEKLAKLQGKVAKVIGLDVDAAIAEHPFLDEHHLIDHSGAFPLADASVDMVVADWVFEHILDPEKTSSELDRVLRPGGWVCARTPNRLGYVGIGTRLIPNSLHVKLLRRLSPERHDVDVFPTAYKLNSLGDLKLRFSPERWNNYSYVCNPSPKYFANSRVIFHMIDFYQSVVPEPLKTDLIVMLQKRR